ncbi:accessory gland protein Acp29AB-like [Drosophila subpulchrella]|uniref:accessory gland protein Acp29AB-like n=1 Tax=Drosophila subpulchrella TaxID=1486046 RepID=UPI0018A13E33|nr:accessory gland protein Acp29AB-like [Drosophila subpulchrella]
MLKLAFAVICGLLAWNSCEVLAETESFCPLKDPPNQCGGFCLSVLTPVLNRLTIPHDQRNPSDKGKSNEVLVRQYTMESQLAALQEKQTTFENSLDNQQKYLDSNQQNLTEKLEDLESQLSALQETLFRVQTKIKYLGFEQIGSKYFYIEKVTEKNWSSASKSCRNMGGHLADIKDQEELTAIQANLKKDTHYWLGINDLGRKDEYLSMATGKPAPFLKWSSGRLTRLETSNCVFLYNGEMYDYPCNYTFRFICQTEEENE